MKVYLMPELELKNKFLGICYWRKIASHFHATGVRYGSVAAAGESILRVRSGELIDDRRC
jgi:hypothetical protein